VEKGGGGERLRKRHQARRILGSGVDFTKLFAHLLPPSERRKPEQPGISKEARKDVGRWNNKTSVDRFWTCEFPVPPPATVYPAH